MGFDRYPTMNTNPNSRRVGFAGATPSGSKSASPTNTPTREKSVRTVDLGGTKATRMTATVGEGATLTRHSS